MNSLGKLLEIPSEFWSEGAIDAQLDIRWKSGQSDKIWHGRIRVDEMTITRSQEVYIRGLIRYPDLTTHPAWITINSDKVATIDIEEIYY